MSEETRDIVGSPDEFTTLGQGSPTSVCSAPEFTILGAHKRTISRRRISSPSGTGNREYGLDESANTTYNSAPKEQKVPAGNKKMHTKSVNVRRSQSVKATRRTEPSHERSFFRERMLSVPERKSFSSAENLHFSGSNKHGFLDPTKDAEYERLRNFSVTSKGVINRGDSFRSRSRSFRYSQHISIPASSETEHSSPDNSLPPPTMTSTRERVSVLVVGCTDVGKSSLTNQFSTSEYICTYDCSLEEKNETSVTVVLNEEEYDLLFIEKTVATETVTSLLNLSVASYVVVYSVVDRSSFQWAKNFISQVVKCVDTMNKALILVGNKTDLVRLRKVSPEEGRSVAASHGFKFIEISTGINHNVDELLVGILNQIRLKRHRVEEMKSGAVVSENPGGRFVGCTGWRTKSIIKRILRRSRVRRSSSCDNFNTL